MKLTFWTQEKDNTNCQLKVHSTTRGERSISKLLLGRSIVIQYMSYTRRLGVKS